VGRALARVGFLAAFLVAMVSLAAGWAALRAAWQTPTVAGWLQTVTYAAVFTVSFLYLGFWLYVWDRAAGRVKRHIGLYERFLQHK
jgi:hypothetical protein